jgi:hypothetical protein
MLWRFPALWRARRKTKRRLDARQFRRLMQRFSVGPRKVAAL